MKLIGDIGNTDVKICLIDNNFKIKKKVIIKSNIINKSKIKNNLKLEIPHWKESLVNCIKKIKI